MFTCIIPLLIKSIIKGNWWILVSTRLNLPTSGCNVTNTLLTVNERSAHY